MSAVNPSSSHPPAQPQSIASFVQTNTRFPHVDHHRYGFAPSFPQIGQICHNPEAFFICQPAALSPPRSPSVASWCNFDSDNEDGLVIEEIDSDDENPDDSNVEVIDQGAYGLCIVLSFCGVRRLPQHLVSYIST